jgi:hypothetical protein
VLLARTLTPEPMRPGWPEALRMARSVLPYERLLAIDERLEHELGGQGAADPEPGHRCGGAQGDEQATPADFTRLFLERTSRC